MKVLRSKKFRRILHFYRLNFGFHRPYKIVCDASFLQTAKENKLHVKDQLKALLAEHKSPSAAFTAGGAAASSIGGSDGVQIFVSSCIHSHLSKLGNAFGGAAFIAKQFPLLRCRHGKNAWSGKGKGKEKLKDDHHQSQENSFSSFSARQSQSAAAKDEGESLSTSVSASSSAASRASTSASSSLDVLSDVDCIRALLSNGNPDGLFVATMDPELQHFVRSQGGVPLIFIHGNAPILDKPSRTSNASFAQQVSVSTSAVLSHTERIANSAAKEVLQIPTESATPMVVEQVWKQAANKILREEKELKEKGQKNTRELGRKRKAKEPNPLSVKKKKVKSAAIENKPSKPSFPSPNSQSNHSSNTLISTLISSASSSSSDSSAAHLSSTSSSPATTISHSSQALFSQKTITKTAAPLSSKASFTDAVQDGDEIGNELDSQSISNGDSTKTSLKDTGDNNLTKAVDVDGSGDSAKSKRKRKRFRVRARNEKTATTKHIEDPDNANVEAENE